ncbi:MAG: heavy-metal-associated domain-containing protein [Bacilli bacterium]|nr:heavy-metal-associated domain-containing protein [Bacilli bacterium]
MKIIFNVEGMHCDGCKKTIENELKTYKDIINVSASLLEKEVTIMCNDGVKIKELEKRIKKSGFKPIGIINTEE